MMTRKGVTVALWRLQAIVAGAVLVALACALSPVPAQAQDPIGGALATLAAATANAEAVRAAQRATAAAISAEAARQANIARATAQAQSAESTRQAQQVIATANAQSAQATQSAIDELNRQRQASATAEYHAAQSTQQAQQATAQALSASATRNVIDAQATRAAYDLRIAQSQEQARLGRILLYVAAGLSLLGTAYVIATWARAIAAHLARRLTRLALPIAPKPMPQTAEVDSVIDGEFEKSPMSTERMPDVHMVDDAALTDAIGKWFYGGGA
jgi:hypothetical protein